MDPSSVRSTVLFAVLSVALSSRISICSNSTVSVVVGFNLPRTFWHNLELEILAETARIGLRITSVTTSS